MGSRINRGRIEIDSGRLFKCRPGQEIELRIPAAGNEITRLALKDGPVVYRVPRL